VRTWHPFILLTAALALTAAGSASARRSGRWISLFDGKDLTGWHLREADAHNGWKAEHGTLTNTPPSADLVSDQKFQDFDLHY